MRVTAPAYSSTEKAKLVTSMKRSKGIKAPFSSHTVNGVEVPAPVNNPKRKWFAPRDVYYVPAKPRGRSGCRLSHEKRLLILERLTAREEFFRALRGE